MNIKKNKIRWDLMVGFICFSTVFLTSLASAQQAPGVHDSPQNHKNYSYENENELARLQSMLKTQKQKNLLLEKKIELLEQELQKYRTSPPTQSKPGLVEE